MSTIHVKCLPVPNFSNADLNVDSSPDDGHDLNVRADSKTARGNSSKSPRTANGIKTRGSAGLVAANGLK